MRSVPRWTLICMASGSALFPLAPKDAAHARSVGATTTETHPDRRSINALIIDRSLFERMCDRAGIEGEFRSDLAMIHGQYLEEVSRIEDDTLRDMSDAGFEEHEELWRTLNPLNSAERVNAARNDHRAMQALVDEQERLKDDPRWERLADLKYAISSAANLGQRRIETARMTLMRTFAQAANLDADTDASLQRYVLRQLLEPPSEPRGMNFIYPTDLFSLLMEAEEWEIGALCESLGEAGYVEVVAPVILQYEVRLDAALREKLSQQLKSPERGVPAVRRPGDLGYSEHDERIASAWSRRHAITAEAVERIAALVESHIGEEAAEAWQQRFTSSEAPEIVQPRWPSRMVEWLEGRDDTSDEQLEYARKLQEGYQKELDTLVRRVFDAGVALKRVGVAAAEELPRELDEYARAALDIHVASRRAITALVPHLNLHQRRALYQLLHDPIDVWHVARLLGPTVDERWLEQEGRLDEYIKPAFATPF